MPSTARLPAPDWVSPIEALSRAAGASGSGLLVTMRNTPLSRPAP